MASVPARSPTSSDADGFPIVGVGASAGGLEAFSELLANLPRDLGMAVVLVQHLDPKHASLLAELLTRTTPMPVIEVRPGTRVAPAYVYVIPPNTTMTISDGMLQLSPRTASGTPHMPVDSFLRSLAEELGEKAIGVVLSGSASDGALGIKAVKGEGGVTFAQDPETARHDGMPRSAIASGAVDFVLSPRGIAQELTRIGRHPYLRDLSVPAVESAPTDERALEQIYRLLQQESGVDFRQYRQTTVRRRIARRMLVHRIDALDGYRRFLEEHRPEIQVLYNEALINVTRFFRDVSTFETLEQLLLSRMRRPRTSDQSSVRVWVPGCATGEEAYSLAMVMVEVLERMGSKTNLQIFGTDVSDVAVSRARGGVYPPNIEFDVSPERLRRFFSKLDGQYQVKKSLRELCVFARHNLAKDPPFSGVDLISCRNVMIYFDAAMQRRIMGTFHYALRSSGLLMLGSSETVGPLAELFTVLDKKHRFYAKKPTSTRFALGSTTQDPRREDGDHGQAIASRLDAAVPRVDQQREVDRILLGRYAPAGVLINEAYDILQFRGQTSPYLEPAPGHASLNLMTMVREGLLMELRGAVLTARKRRAPVRREGLRVKQATGFVPVNIEVIPIRGPGDDSNYLVLFESVTTARAAKSARARPVERTLRERELQRLDQELTATREFLQSIIEDREAANEELRSANEELQSSNEELQSTNEEMETAKEELQAVNEELVTVNEELQHRNVELAQLNDDLNNLIASVDIPIVIIGNDLRIRRFTPQAAKVFNLLPADLGRPIATMRQSFEVPDLEQMTAEVVDTVRPIVLEARDRQDRWYSISIRPYRTAGNSIEGAVIALLDVTTMKASLELVTAARDYAEAVVDTIRTPLLVLDEDLRVRSANRAFFESFEVTAEQTIHRILFELGQHQWEIPALRRALGELLERGTTLEDFEVEHEFPSIGTRTMILNARLARGTAELPVVLLLAIEDITVRRQAERELRASEEVRYRRLFETTRDGIVLLDADSGQITNVNPFWLSLTGLAAEDVLGRPLWELPSFEDAEKVRGIVRELQERDLGRYEDLRLTRRDGVRRHIDLSCNVYRLGGKRVIQCVGRDITERLDLLERERAARTEAEAANRAKDDFLSVLSHELRTPLTAMLGWVSVLRRGALDPSRIGEALETVERNTRLLAQLIEDLLDVSRIAAGKLTIAVRRVDLGAVVGAAVETVRESVESKGLRLEIDLAEAPIPVQGDPHRLQQVVWNLLSNAVKFTPRGGRVAVRLEPIAWGARITVSDTGRGIAPELLPQIFDRFRQGEGVSGRGQSGLGLGLAIVRHLVEVHEGRVSAFSAGVGQGATFTVDLPQPPAADQTGEGSDGIRERPSEMTSADARLDGLRVLVVEDEADTRRMLTEILAEHGAEVVSVETCGAGLAALEASLPHVIVSDIGLPGGDGYAFIREVRRRAAAAGGTIPAIALTAFARGEDVRRALDAGFNLHVAKPVDPAELARIVEQLARRVV